jgi:hypothetical protein
LLWFGPPAKKVAGNEILGVSSRARPGYQGANIGFFNWKDKLLAEGIWQPCKKERHAELVEASLSRK